VEQPKQKAPHPPPQLTCTLLQTGTGTNFRRALHLNLHHAACQLTLTMTVREQVAPLPVQSSHTQEQLNEDKQLLRRRQSSIAALDSSITLIPELQNKLDSSPAQLKDNVKKMFKFVRGSKNI